MGTDVLQSRRDELKAFMDNELPQHVSCCGQYLPASLRIALVAETERQCGFSGSEKDPIVSIRGSAVEFKRRYADVDQEKRWDEYFARYAEDKNAAVALPPVANKELRATTKLLSPVVASLTRLQRYIDAFWYAAAMKRVSEYTKVAKAVPEGVDEEVRVAGTLAEIRSLVMLACARCFYFIALGEKLVPIRARIVPAGADGDQDEEEQPSFLPKTIIHKPSSLAYGHAVRSVQDYTFDPTTVHLRSHLERSQIVSMASHPFYSLGIVPREVVIVDRCHDLFYVKADQFLNMGVMQGRGGVHRSQVEAVAHIVAKSINCSY
mmetsp:Transcript_29821/g.55749  ORF Transcript_29821/g.55749 Transcript_29821/m.55749 type:complete len:321 (-) Transcript_29821:742-1704(-)